MTSQFNLLRRREAGRKRYREVLYSVITKSGYQNNQEKSTWRWKTEKENGKVSLQTQNID